MQPQTFKQFQLTQVDVTSTTPTESGLIIKNANIIWKNVKLHANIQIGKPISVLSFVMLVNVGSVERIEGGSGSSK